MKFKSLLTGEVVGLEEIKDWYKLEPIEENVTGTVYPKYTVLDSNHIQNNNTNIVYRLIKNSIPAEKAEDGIYRPSNIPYEEYVEILGILYGEHPSATRSVYNISERVSKMENIEENNGGKTSYYDLPTVDDGKLIYILSNKIKGSTPIECRLASDSIRELLPTTLNDLIEYKNMYPFQHEIFKACYALQERADKDIKGGSILRELNKIKYYIERGIALAKAGKI